MRWIVITKTKMVVIFNLLNPHLSTVSLPTEEVFQVNCQNRPVANLPGVATFGFSFSKLVFFPFYEGLNLIVCQRYGFFSALAAIIRESSVKQLVLRIVKALPFNYQPDRVAPKASVSSWLAISTHVKKYEIFSSALLRLFSGPEILV